jgi:hypothetical protein
MYLRAIMSNRRRSHHDTAHDQKRKESTSGKPSDDKTRSELSNVGGPDTSVPAAGASVSESGTGGKEISRQPTTVHAPEQAPRPVEDSRNPKADPLLNFNKACGHLPPPYLFSPRYQSEEESPAGPRIGHGYWCRSRIRILQRRPSCGS